MMPGPRSVSLTVLTNGDQFRFASSCESVITVANDPNEKLSLNATVNETYFEFGSTNLQSLVEYYSLC